MFFFFIKIGFKKERLVVEKSFLKEFVSFELNLGLLDWSVSVNYSIM